MIDANFIINEPIDFRGICKIYAPTVRQIVKDQKFLVYRRILTISQEDLEDELLEQNKDLKNVLTPLEYLLNSSFNNKKIEMEAKEAFFYFIKEPVNFIYESKKILIGDVNEVLKTAKSAGELRFLDEDNFFDFQNFIRNSLGEDSIEPPRKNEHIKIKRMKAKARYRDKIKAKKSGLSLDTILISICCMGIGITPLNIGELSYATAIRLMSVYQDKEAYETDVRSLLAGASSDKVKPKYWIHNYEK